MMAIESEEDLMAPSNLGKHLKKCEIGFTATACSCAPFILAKSGVMPVLTDNKS